MSNDTRVALGLGANMHEPEAMLRQALDALATAGVRELQHSHLYDTAPVDCVPGTPRFCNAAAIGLWPHSAMALLRACQAVEIGLGRPADHSPRESRPIDIDILLFGSQRFARPQLVVPHPRMCQRLFVLVPLAEIAADWQIPPSLGTVAEVRDRVLRSATDRWGARRTEN